MGLGEYRIKAYNPTYNFIIGIIFQNTWYKEAKGWGLVSYDPYKPTHNCINYKIGLLLCHSHIELRLWLRLS